METPSKDKYILRFEQQGHRDRLKQLAEREKRSLNKQILLLIEAGEHALQRTPRPAANPANGEASEGITARPTLHVSNPDVNQGITT